MAIGDQDRTCVPGAVAPSLTSCLYQPVDFPLGQIFSLGLYAALGNRRGGCVSVRFAVVETASLIADFSLCLRVTGLASVVISYVSEQFWPRRMRTLSLDLLDRTRVPQLREDGQSRDASL